MDTDPIKEEIFEILDTLNSEQLQRFLVEVERIFLEEHGVPIAEYVKNESAQTRS